MEKELLKNSPKQIREEILGFETNKELIMVDEHWKDRPIDISVGDFILVPNEFQIMGHNAEVFEERNDGLVLRGIKQGISQITSTKHKWGAFARVSRENYTGLNCFRFLEEPEDEE